MRALRTGRMVATGILAILLLAGCSPIAPGVPGSATPNPETGATELGLTLSPAGDAELTAQDLARILQIHLWKFDAHMPASDQIRYQLELLSPGRETELLASFAMTWPEAVDAQVLVAIYPVNGSFLDTEGLRYYIGAGGSSTSGIMPNPGTEYELLSPQTPAQTLEMADGRTGFILMEFSETGGPIPDPKNTRLVLTAQAVEDGSAPARPQ
jgi:hypothetical protein